MNHEFSIGHYRVTCKLGEGGMGEVWRGTDTRLNREVAIKVLPEAFAQDPERMARFRREAQVLASLNHPNIAAIYGIEERALVMELVEGPTLAERIAQGPMPLEEALEIARQIADALEAAHEKGVVHRDLKPANIKVTPDGRVKVLDFGLAKAMGTEPASGDPVSSPTLTMRATVAGVILGTAGYMAPEQAKGKAVDKRADIWAFGVVLCEMLTGQPLFTGETVSDSLAAVLTKEPDWERVPARARKLLQGCLEKEPKRRLRDIGDAWRLVDEAGQGGRQDVSRPGSFRWMAAALSIVLAAAAAGWWRATRPMEHPLTRLAVDLGPDAVPGLSTTIAISPDGRRLVFPVRGPDGAPHLATRLLDQARSTLLPGTKNGHDPFFSPDGQWIGFFNGTQVRKVSVQGGTAVTLSNFGSTQQQGGSWCEDGGVVTSLSLSSGLVRVPTAGGKPQTLTTLTPGELTHRWPQVLPGGKVVLFTASSNLSAMEDASIEAVDLRTGAVKVVQRGGYYGRYLSSGHLVYVHQGVLYGVPFDSGRLEERGAPVPLLDDLAGDSVNGGGQYDVSAAPSGAGTLVYLAGKPGIKSWYVAWLDNSGKTQPLIAAPNVYYNHAFSPDGRRLALDVGPKGTDIFVYDLPRATMLRLTFDGASDRPVWAPDGRHIIFQSNASRHALWWVRSDGAEQPELLLETRNLLVPWSLAPDGRRLACWEVNPEGYNGIWIVPLDTSDPDHPKAGKPEPFRRAQAGEMMPVFSQDGRWIAYRSNESGADEIYVRGSSGGGGHWQISAGGGLFAFWARNGRELFYETADNRIMLVDYTANGASFVPGQSRLWSDRRIFSPGRSNLDLAPDGNRFAVFQATDEPEGPPHLVFLLNFFDWLQRQTAAGGK